MSATTLETIFYTSPKGEPTCCPQRSFYDAKLRTCKARFCPRCGVPWARDVGTRSRVNLRVYRGDVALITVTAPGADLLPWACTKEHKHSGWKGCRVADGPADRWCETKGERYKKLRDGARLAVKRRIGLKPQVLERAWEPQKRGVPHVHLVVGMGTPGDRVAAKAFAEELHRLAGEHQFGFVDRKLQPISAANAARYLSSYLTGRSSKKSSIRENIADPRMPAVLVWISPRLTQKTGVTARTLRHARHFFAVVKGYCEEPPRLHGRVAAATARALVWLEADKAGRAPPELEGPDGICWLETSRTEIPPPAAFEAAISARFVALKHLARHTGLTRQQLSVMAAAA